MLFIETFLYYTVFASVILVYGIGLNRAAELGISRLDSITFYIKALICIFTTSVVSWVITAWILQPLHLVELYPVVIFLVYICLNAFLEAIIRLTTGKTAVEFIVTYLIGLLSISESTSVLNTIIICLSCCVTFVVLVPFCVTFRRRYFGNTEKIDERYYAYFFVFMGILILLVSALDIIWFTSGVIQ